MKMGTTGGKSISVGNRNLNPPQWVDFDWEDPKHGHQAKGEVTVIRPEGTSGELAAGLWRTGHGIVGCEADGSCTIRYSAPLGDETMVLLEGSALITETATGKQHRVAAGTILSHPKGVDLLWQIDRPFLKKFWVMWNSAPKGATEHGLYVANINDNASRWQPFVWSSDSAGGPTAGEFHVVRGQGSTGTYRCGLWRSGVGIAGCLADGSASFSHCSPHGDETLVLLEGQAHLLNEETGEEYVLQAGDIVGLPEGLPVKWTSKGPFLKKFSVFTRG